MSFKASGAGAPGRRITAGFGRTTAKVNYRIIDLYFYNYEKAAWDKGRPDAPIMKERSGGFGPE